MDISISETPVQVIDQSFAKNEQERQKTVQVGSEVTIQFPPYEGGEQGELSIVRIVESPVLHKEDRNELYVGTIVAQAILGKREGEQARIESNDRSLSYDVTILKVEN